MSDRFYTRRNKERSKPWEVVHDWGGKEESSPITIKVVARHSNHQAAFNDAKARQEKHRGAKPHDDHGARRP